MSLSNFEQIKKIGDGAYSTVLKVRRRTDNQIYALKKVRMQKLTAKQKRNALNQVRIMASINHPNVIAYKQAFFDDQAGALCLVMEFANNGDLYQRILQYQKKRCYMSENFIWNLLVQTVKGLKTLHDLNVLHRDLKSANVFLNTDGSVKLGDMNVSKVAQQGLLYTQTGTPYYASPQVWQDKPYDLKSDIWSLGCVIYQAICLKPPFRAEDMQGLYRKVLKGQYACIPKTFSKDLSVVLESLLQIDPAKRPTCEQILKMPVVERHSGVFQDTPQAALIGEIRMPKSTNQITASLPRPTYHMQPRNSDPFPSSKTQDWSFVERLKRKNQRANRSETEKKEILRENYGALKLPRLKYPVQKPRRDQSVRSLPLPLAPRIERIQKAYIRNARPQLAMVRDKREQQRKPSYASPSWWR